MSTVTLEVEPATKGDVWRSRARIDRKTMSKLGLEPGDTVLIEGESKTATSAWRLPRREWERDIVRMNGFVQENAGVERFDEVRLQRIEPRPAEEVVVVPGAGDGDAVTSPKGDWLNVHLAKQVVTPGDTLLLRNTYHSMTQAPITELPQVTVTETSANQPVIITEDTKLTIEA